MELVNPKLLVTLGNVPTQSLFATSQGITRMRGNWKTLTIGNWTGPAVPALTSVNTQPDLLFDAQKGKYYGHPNPARCEYAAFGANPTSGNDTQEVSEYPSGTDPDRNFARAAYNLGDHASANGALEYCGSQWNGELRGMLLVTRYSDGKDIIALKVQSNGAVTQLIDAIPGADGLFDDDAEDVTGSIGGKDKVVIPMNDDDPVEVAKSGKKPRGWPVVIKSRAASTTKNPADF